MPSPCNVQEGSNGKSVGGAAFTCSTDMYPIILIFTVQQLLYILLWIAPTNGITPCSDQMFHEVYALGTAFVRIDRALAFGARHCAFEVTCEVVFQRQVFLKLSLSNMRSGILLTCEMLGKVNSGGLLKKDIRKTCAIHVTI